MLVVGVVNPPRPEMVTWGLQAIMRGLFVDRDTVMVLGVQGSGVLCSIVLVIHCVARTSRGPRMPQLRVLLGTLTFPPVESSVLVVPSTWPNMPVSSPVTDTMASVRSLLGFTILNLSV